MSNAKKPREWPTKRRGQRDGAAMEIVAAIREIRRLRELSLSGQLTNNGRMVSLLMIENYLLRAAAHLIDAGAPIDTEAL